MDLIEMATLRKRDSGLPVNLYIDDSLSYERGGHYKRVKFQTDKGEKPNTRSNFSSMTLDGNIILKTLPQKLELSNRDLKRISNFVKNNSECLSLVSDMDMDFDDFKDYFMIEGGEEADEDRKEKVHKAVVEYLKENRIWQE